MSGQARSRARPDDTSPEIWAMQLRRWEAMDPAQRLAVADRLSIDCMNLARKARTEQR